MDMTMYHVNGGTGENSYARNNAFQLTKLAKLKVYVYGLMMNFIYSEFGFPSKDGIFKIADIGCTYGVAAVEIVNRVVSIIADAHRPVDNIELVLIDRPGNDFDGLRSVLSQYEQNVKREKSHIFKTFHCNSQCIGHLHGQIFADESLHFVHSSGALNWLTQVPPSLSSVIKDDIYISMFGPSVVVDAYRSQFKHDFLTFLKSRSMELVKGGRMALSFVGRENSNPTHVVDFYAWNIMSDALLHMVKKRHITRANLGKFYVPYYQPSEQEVREFIQEDSTFQLFGFYRETFGWDGISGYEDEPTNSTSTGHQRGQRLAKMHRAATESIIRGHFGSQVIEPLYEEYAKLLEDYMFRHGYYKVVYYFVTLIKR